MIDLDIVNKQLPLPIHSVETIGDITVVLVDDGKGCKYEDTSRNRNVYAFDIHGDLIWQIQEIFTERNYAKPYLTLTVKDGKLYTYNWIGMDYLVDLKDGSIHFFGPPRRPW